MLSAIKLSVVMLSAHYDRYLAVDFNDAGCNHSDYLNAERH